jgi:hypothetical protein
MLPPSAPETDVHEGKPTLEEVLHGAFDEVKSVVSKRCYFTCRLKVGTYIQVKAGFALKPLFAPGIGE